MSPTKINKDSNFLFVDGGYTFSECVKVKSISSVKWWVDVYGTYNLLKLCAGGSFSVSYGKILGESMKDRESAFRL